GSPERPQGRPAPRHQPRSRRLRARTHACVSWLSLGSAGPLVPGSRLSERRVETNPYLRSERVPRRLLAAPCHVIQCSPASNGTLTGAALWLPPQSDGGRARGRGRGPSTRAV